MPRNKKTVLPMGHVRKYTSNGTKQVSQEQRVAQAKALVEVGKRQAEKEAAAERANAAAVESRWQDFNPSTTAIFSHVRAPSYGPCGPPGRLKLAEMNGSSPNTNSLSQNFLGVS